MPENEQLRNYLHRPAIFLYIYYIYINLYLTNRRSSLTITSIVAVTIFISTSERLLTLWRRDNIAYAKLFKLRTLHDTQ